MGWLERGRAIGRSAPLAVIVLLLANAIPLGGVLFLGWDAAAILMLFWLENGIVGLLNVPKIVLTALGASDSAARGRSIYAAILFPIHYGFFWYVHGVFVLLLIGAGGYAPFDLGAMLRAATADSTVLLAAAALLTSHAVSFVVNYVGQAEYRRTTAERQAGEPYPRMIVLHMTVILGGLLALRLDEPIGLLVGLVVIKTIVDLLLHLRQHRQRSEPAAAPAM
ncbi:MAG: DUF6498-containing protein [Chloroflexota bacterium]|nr:DUF6498-containing protein [Chloroflexota bacterium]